MTNSQALHKLQNLASIAKNYNFQNDSFFAVAEYENGWSDGIMLDLNHYQDMYVKAYPKREKMYRFIVDGDKPKAEPILNDIKDKEFVSVNDVEYDLTDGNAWLINSEDVKVKVNPIFIKYFLKAYKNEIDFLICESNTVIKVVGQDGKAVGFIAPIKT